jgi:hypothetical protein
MINGCLAWQRHGLLPPETVHEATAGYFDNQDLFAQWVEEECDACPGDASIYDTSTNLSIRGQRSPRPPATSEARGGRSPACSSNAGLRLTGCMAACAPGAASSFDHENPVTHGDASDAFLI